MISGLIKPLICIAGPGKEAGMVESAKVAQEIFDTLDNVFSGKAHFHCMIKKFQTIPGLPRHVHFRNHSEMN